jgi:DNA-binding transcriptional regulator GbsR (MarR family)
MDPARTRFVERFGLLFEEEGFPRIAGRLTAHLLVSDREQSLDEIADALGVSKASVSTDARRLEAKGIIERTSRPGDRRDYYRVAPDGFRTMLQARLESLRRFDAVLRDAGQLSVPSAVRRRITEWSEFHQSMIDAFTTVLARLEPPAGAPAGPRSPR